MDFIRTYSIEQIDEIATDLLHYRTTTNLFCFSGELGAGKTTLVKAICRKLLVDKQTVSSPSFAIVHEYFSTLWGQYIYHMDFYRLNTPNDLQLLDMEEKLETHFCLIEWPRFPRILSGHHPLWVSLEEIAEDKHQRKIHASFTPPTDSLLIT